MSMYYYSVDDNFNWHLEQYIFNNDLQRRKNVKYIIIKNNPYDTNIVKI